MTIETKLCEAITEMLREIERCPDDSIADIANKALRSWKTGLHVTSSYCVEPDPLQS